MGVSLICVLVVLISLAYLTVGSISRPSEKNLKGDSKASNQTLNLEDLCFTVVANESVVPSSDCGSYPASKFSMEAMRKKLKEQKKFKIEARESHASRRRSLPRKLDARSNQQILDLIRARGEDVNSKSTPRAISSQRTRPSYSKMGLIVGPG